VTGDLGGVDVEDAVLLDLPGATLSGFGLSVHVPCDGGEHFPSVSARMAYRLLEIAIAPVLFLAPKVTAPDRVGSITETRRSVVCEEENRSVVALIDERLQDCRRRLHRVDPERMLEVTDAREALATDRVWSSNHDVERNAAGSDTPAAVREHLHVTESTVQVAAAARLTSAKRVAKPMCSRRDLGA